MELIMHNVKTVLISSIRTSVTNKWWIWLFL